MRDGSSTKNATPDEIARMGAAQVLPDTPQPIQEWTNERVISSLQKSIDSIDELKTIPNVHSPEFREWHRATLYMIKSAFGDRSIHYWDYPDIVDHIYPTRLYGFMGWRIITGSWRRIIPQRLDEAAELLTSFVDELKRY